MNPDQAAAVASSGPSLAILIVIGIISLVCWIKVLIASFKTSGALIGIFGIITCGLVTFVWGWIKSGALGIRTTMIVWTLCWVGSFVVQGKMAADVMSSPAMQKAIKDAQQQQAAPAPAPAPPNN